MYDLNLLATLFSFFHLLFRKHLPLFQSLTRRKHCNSSIYINIYQPIEDKFEPFEREIRLNLISCSMQTMTVVCVIFVMIILYLKNKSDERHIININTSLCIWWMPFSLYNDNVRFGSVRFGWYGLWIYWVLIITMKLLKSEMKTQNIIRILRSNLVFFQSV